MTPRSVLRSLGHADERGLAVQDLPTVRIDRSLRRSLAMFGDDRLGWLDRAAELGPLSGLRLGPATVFVVTDAELARAVLVTDRAWTRPPSQRVPVALAVGDNLFSASERTWARTQPTIAPAFRRRALAAPLSGLGDVLAEHVEAIPIGKDLDLGAVMARLAFVAAAWVMLGDRLDAARADALVEHQRHVVDWVGRRLGALDSAIPLALGRAAREMREHRRELEQYVDDAAARVHRSSNVPLILAAAEAAGGGGASPSSDQLLGLLLAGNETTAAGLCWLLVHGASQPSDWRRLATDAGRVHGFVAETLRLSPPAWGVTRTPMRHPVTLASGEVSMRVRRPGVVTIYVRGIQRSERHWPDPLRFDPDRHGDASSARALLPFALGARGCVGQHLALEELTLLARLLAELGDVALDPVEEDASFALRPRGSLRGRFCARPGAIAGPPSR